MRRQRRPAALAVLAMSAALAAGCGSSSSSSANGAKSPVKFMVETAMTPAAALAGASTPFPATTAKAAAAAINAKGGIDGHQIQIDVCDNQGNPDQSAACGRRAKSNGDIAVIGSFDATGATQILPVLQAEGIPWIGSVAASAAELSNPDAFTFDSGAFTAGYAAAGAYHDQGCKNVALFFTVGTPDAQKQIDGLKAIADADGYHIQTVDVSLTQPSVSAPVSTALSLHPDCISFLGNTQTNVKLIAALRQGGYTGKYFTDAGSLPQSYLKSLGKLGNGIILMAMSEDPYSSDPLVTAFRNQVTSYTGSKSAAAPNLNEFGQNAWSAVQLVDKALTGTGSYTSAELLKKLPTMCDVNVGNYYPHINFCKPAVKSTLYPRIYNDNWQYYTTKNGAYVPLSTQWHDFSSTVPAS